MKKYKIVPYDGYFKVYIKSVFGWKKIDTLCTFEKAVTLVGNIVQTIYYDEKGNKI